MFVGIGIDILPYVCFFNYVLFSSAFVLLSVFDIVYSILFYFFCNVIIVFFVFELAFNKFFPHPRLVCLNHSVPIPKQY